MASASKILKTRKRMKACKAGRDRKQWVEKHGSTPTRAVFFGDVAAASPEPACSALSGSSELPAR